MRKLIGILTAFLFLTACNNQEQKSHEGEDIRYRGTINIDTIDESRDSNLLDKTETEKDGVIAEKEEDTLMTGKEINSQELTGTYLLVDSGNKTCNCSCLEISFTSPTNLCISPEKILISATYKKAGTNSVDIFLSEVIKAEVKDRDIPWDDFDRNTPIATVHLQPDQTLKLDWLGFAIDGEIAVDYAIYGKKTLEGTYKRK